MSDHSPFFSAVKEGRLNDVRGMLSADPDLGRAKGEGATALHFAAIGNNRAMVDLLLGSGADLRALPRGLPERFLSSSRCRASQVTAGLGGSSAATSLMSTK